MVEFYFLNCWLCTGSLPDCERAQGHVGLKISEHTQIHACASQSNSSQTGRELIAPVRRLGRCWYWEITCWSGCNVVDLDLTSGFITIDCELLLFWTFKNVHWGYKTIRYLISCKQTLFNMLCELGITMHTLNVLKIVGVYWSDWCDVYYYLV